MQLRDAEKQKSEQNMNLQEPGKYPHRSDDKSKSIPSFIKGTGLEDLPYNFELRKLLRGILRHLGIILICMVIGGAIGGYLSYRLLHTFSAESILIYSAPQRGQSDERYQILHLTPSSALEMITLPIQLKAVKSILGLDLSIEDLKKMITVDYPGHDSNLISISVKANNPSLAIDIANTLANVVMKSTQDLIQKQWQGAYSYFKSQQEILRQKAEDQTKQIAEYRKKYHFLGMDIASSSTLTDMRNTQLKLDASNEEYTRMLVEYENLTREYQKIPEHLSRTNIEDTLTSNRINQVENALFDARTKYAPENPKIKSLEAQLQLLQKTLEDEKANPKPQESADDETGPINPLRTQLDMQLIEMQAKLRAIQKDKEDLASQLQTQKEQSTHWSEEQGTFAKLLNEKNSTDKQLASIDQTLHSIEVILGIGKGDLEIYQGADKSFSNENSIWVELLPVLGFILGTCFGIAVAFALEVTDTKIRTSRQIELAYHLPCLASIPELQLLLKKNAERKMRFYIRNLIDRIHLKGPFSSLALTSSTSGEGKSCIAYHIALQYVNMGKKTLYLELDHRPNPNFNAESAAPSFLENYLKGQVSLEDIIYHGPLDRIKVDDEFEMKELMKSEQLKKLWMILKQTYDMIILDVPGIIGDESGIHAVTLADQSIFIIGSIKSNKEYIDASLKELEVYGVKPCGIVLNRVLPIYSDNLQAAEENKKSKLRFFENLLKRKPPK